MNILIPNNWLREFLKTNATPFEFANAMSLSSVSIERMENVDDDIVFDIEVTTNRPDLMSIEGIAKEAAAVLPQAGFKAEFVPKRDENKFKTAPSDPLLTIQNDKSLVNRILAVVMEVNLKTSPKEISEKLEKTGIRSINNAVDVTNYIMREVGHPSHVFDYDRLPNKTLIIRRSKKGERIVTLDGLEYLLPGDDIVADDGSGEIVDLLGIMGTANSIVVDTTKRIVLFLDNNNPLLLRKTSMNLGIRTEAAVLNEKDLDPELMMPTMLRGIRILEEIADAKAISPIIDIYPNKVATKKVVVKKILVSKLIGIEIPEHTIEKILINLGFEVKNLKDSYEVTVPTIRINDIDIPEDIVEEIARIYGYHKIPNSLPYSSEQAFYHQEKDEFYWIQKLKEAFKYWGYNETYTYSMVSEALFDGPIEKAVKIKNPLTEDRVFLRNSLIPSLIEIKKQNKNKDEVRLFEISNVYVKKTNNLPDEVQHLAVLSNTGSFYDMKGVAEAVFSQLGLEQPEFLVKEESINGASIIYKNKNVGYIEEDEDMLLELDLSFLLESANNSKKYTPPAKFPPIIEDVRVEFPKHYSFDSIVKAVKGVSDLVEDVTIYDEYKEKKITYRITFQSRKKSLSNEDVAPVRESIYKLLEDKFKAKIG